MLGLDLLKIFSLCIPSVHLSSYSAYRHKCNYLVINFGMVENADCGLRTADCVLRTVDCGLRTADCGLYKRQSTASSALFWLKFQHKVLFFYVKICISNTIWSINNYFFNKLLIFNTKYMDFNVHAFDTAN